MSTTITLEDGVVDYPISKGMALGGIWQYKPNPNGPVITAQQDALNISRGPISAYNQWTMLSINHQLQAQGGICVACNLRLDTVSVSEYLIHTSV